jgi:hypothetical protein
VAVPGLDALLPPNDGAAPIQQADFANYFEAAEPIEPHRPQGRRPYSGDSAPKRNLSGAALTAIGLVLLLAVGLGIWSLGGRLKVTTSIPPKGPGLSEALAGQQTAAGNGALPAPAATAPDGLVDRNAFGSVPFSTPTDVPQPPSQSMTVSNLPTSSGGPAHLVLDLNTIDVGATTSAISLVLSNTGAENLAWTSNPGAAWLNVSPTSGSLPGNHAGRVQLSVNRSGMSEGNFGGTLTFRVARTGQQIDVHVNGRAEHPPVVTASSNRPLLATAAKSVANCKPRSATITVTATDENPITAAATWDNGTTGSQTVALPGTSGNAFTFNVGPFAATLTPKTAPKATAVVTVTITDSRGNKTSVPVSLGLTRCT